MTSFATLSLKAQLQTSDENWNAVIAALSKHTQPRILYGPNSNGANVFLWYEKIQVSSYLEKNLEFVFSFFLSSSEDGSQFAIHEIIAREYTNLFDFIGTEEDCTSQDPYGNYVFLFHGLDSEVLEGLRDLLYTGKACLTEERNKADLLSLLAEDLTPRSSPSNDKNQDEQYRQHKTLVPNIPGETSQQIVTPKLLATSKTNKNKGYMNVTQEPNEDHYSFSENGDFMVPMETSMLDNQNTPDKVKGKTPIDFGELVHEAINFEESISPEERCSSPSGNEDSTEMEACQENQKVKSENQKSIDPKIFERRSTFSSFSDFQAKWNQYTAEKFFHYMKKSSHKNKEESHNLTLFPYTDFNYRCINFGEPRSRGKGIRINHNYTASGCAAQIRVLLDTKRMQYIVSKFEPLHKGHEPSEKAYKQYWRYKKLPEEKEQEYAGFVDDLGSDRAKVLERIREVHGSDYSFQDLQNMLQRRRKKQPKNTGSEMNEVLDEKTGSIKIKK